jgi:HSP20 family protein
MVMRYDPFRDVDRLTQQLQSMTSSATLMAMDAYRRGDSVFVHFDLPGVDPTTIDVTAERNTLTVEAERRWNQHDGDQIIARERPEGRFSRQLMLGEHLDVDAIDARYEDGVLTLEIPVAETAKPRRVEIRATSHESSAIDVESSDTSERRESSGL